jgi:hypothetical protein
MPGNENGGFRSVLVKKTGCMLAELNTCNPPVADVLLLVIAGGIASIWFLGAFWALNAADVI